MKVRGDDPLALPRPFALRLGSLLGAVGAGVLRTERGWWRDVVLRQRWGVCAVYALARRGWVCWFTDVSVELGLYNLAYFSQ